MRSVQAVSIRASSSRLIMRSRFFGHLEAKNASEVNSVRSRGILRADFISIGFPGSQSAAGKASGKPSEGATLGRVVEWMAKERGERRDMNRIEVTARVQVYEVNGEEVKSIVASYVNIKSHWNRNDMVVLEFKNGVTLTVVASDLEKAIQNATNV